MGGGHAEQCDLCRWGGLWGNLAVVGCGPGTLPKLQMAEGFQISVGVFVDCASRVGSVLGSPKFALV